MPSTNKKSNSARMNYFQFLGFLILTMKTTSLSAFRLRQANGTKAPSIAPTAKAQTTAAPKISGFAILMGEFDALVAKDVAISTKMEELRDKVEALSAKDTTLFSKNAALTRKVEALTKRVDNPGQTRKDE